MSFVSAAPELIESAAHDLSGIGSTLGEATHFAAAPTTSIAAAGADEVSAAIAALFGSHGQEFQALSAQAAAFHDEFVGLMKSGAGAYVSSEAANAGQLLAENEIGNFAATVAAPYESLFSNTAANLHTMETAISANPHPLLQQIIRNQAGYAKTVGTGFVHSIENIPAQLEHLPAEIQSGVRTLSSVNPETMVQHFINNQTGYGQTISTSSQAARHDFTSALRALPASLQTVFGDLSVGNTTGALNALGRGFGDLLLTGFNTTSASGVTSVIPAGTLGDLLPILSIPGQMAQNFANLFPAGSLAGHAAQNFANVIKTVTDLNLTGTASFVEAPGFGIDLDTTVGLPLVLLIDALGGPVNALNALGSSVHAITGALQTGNLLGAVDGLLNAPAKVVNGFLNGQTTLPISMEALGLPVTVDIPLDGILVPATQYGGTIPGLSQFGFNLYITGTPIGGLLPELLTDLPADFAAALGGPPAPVIPIVP